MPLLHNRVNNQELKQKMLEATEKRSTISFYQYFLISDPTAFRDFLYLHLQKLGVLGRIYVANEGINAQVSVPTERMDNLKEFLYSIEPLNGIRLNVAVDDDGKSFWVLKIKVREKIVADGIEDSAFSMELKGKYVNAEHFNLLMEKEDTIVVDMRNHYEFEVGRFDKALEVPSDTFREQLPMSVEMLRGKEDNNIVMYCTGGIRCEKASAFLRFNGFRNVYHLEGGIINYVKEAREQGLENRFRGKNFVFDNRLGERVSDDVISKCHQCGKPSDMHTNCANDVCHLLFIQCKECAEEYSGCCSNDCVDMAKLPDEERKNKAKIIFGGNSFGAKSFNKSQQRVRPKLKGSPPFTIKP